MQNEKNNAKFIDVSKVANKIYYYDDNRKIYRIDKDLIPNSTYTLNKYTYKTNDLGAILSAEAAPLRLKTHNGRHKIKDTLNDIGKGFQRLGDDRGHLIGDQFGGYNKIGNLIPQNAMINKGAFKQLEDELANLIKEGRRIDFRIELKYPQRENMRPDFIIATYIIDGIRNIKTFHNSQP